MLPALCTTDGNTTKALWTTAGAAWESVLIRHSGRATLCVSSQAGCALGCAFCATGRGGWGRDLTAEEILLQAAWASDLASTEGTRLRNVVFMGMGEPLLNPRAVADAVDALLDQRRYEIAPRYLCVSTAGVVPAIEPFFRRFPKVKLAVSLHAARQDLRDRLMPGTRPWPLTDLMPVLDAYAAHTGHKLFLEYVMIAGVNDGDREAQELVELLDHRRAHVNLIPYNAGSGEAWSASPRPTLDRFQQTLRSAGIAATVRRPAGDAITAACGQLAGKAPSGNN